MTEKKEKEEFILKKVRVKKVPIEDMVLLAFMFFALGIITFVFVDLFSPLTIGISSSANQICESHDLKLHSYNNDLYNLKFEFVICEDFTGNLYRVIG